MAAVSSCIPHHNHTLIQSRAAANACSATRYIPPELVQLGQQLKKAGWGHSDIFNVLVRNCTGDVTFNKADVRTLFEPTPVECFWDAQNFVTDMEGSGHFCRTDRDTQGRIERVNPFLFYKYICKYNFLLFFVWQGLHRNGRWIAAIRIGLIYTAQCG